MKKIFLSVIITYLLTFNTLLARDNKWHAGDFARVVSMCNSSNVLEVMADLMAERPKKMMNWLIKYGILHYSQVNVCLTVHTDTLYNWLRNLLCILICMATNKMENCGRPL